jgi:hypothetical protein
MYDSVGFVKALFRAIGCKKSMARRLFGKAGVKSAFFAFISTLDTGLPKPTIEFGSNLGFFLRFDP